jgi:putative FmdB family regulatory protein
LKELPLPLYEYECAKCKHRFERLEKLSASATDKKCPKCGAQAERQVSSAAIQFKGSGWYVTDYAHKGGSESSHDPAEKPAAKSDSKSGESSGTSASQSNTESAGKSSGEKDSSLKSPEKTSSEKSSVGKSAKRSSPKRSSKN